ncbi:MAG TPA: arsinothricin resistance N-acetyltransferase ArsN1 family B [Steroidobacteraceae bacterium]|nr:arsinothricin resistance N-acetyltransferase ArsN1 family B [Steroidobacteraceae bacterium]
MIRPAKSEDAAQICDIYNHYVRETVVTFEESPVSANEMAQRIADITTGLPWLVWEEDAVVLGYAYAGPWRVRAAYRHSVEASVYLRADATGRGIGSSLYRGLIEDLRRRDIHAVIGGAALPNPRSVALHEKLGFEKVAQFQQVGFKFGRWVDVAYWELVLDRKP